MGGWLRHHPATWASPPGQRRRSVHRLAKMASRRRFGAFVYTVATWAWVVGGLGIAIVYTNGRIGPLGAVLGHLCTLLRRESRYESRRELPAPGGASASTTTACRRRPLAGPSRLVGKTGSARVSPPLGWCLRRGVNPHEPLKSPDSWRGRSSSHCHSALNVPKSHVHHRVAV